MKACGDPNHGEHVTVPAPCHLSEGGGRLISRQQVMVLIEIYYRPMMMMPLGHWPIGPCRTIPYMLHTTILVALPLLRCYRLFFHFRLQLLATKDGQLNRVAGNTISVPVVGAILAVLLAGCVLIDDGDADAAMSSSATWVGRQRIAESAGKLDCVLPAREYDSKKRSSSSSVAVPKPKASKQRTLHDNWRS